MFGGSRDCQPKKKYVALSSERRCLVDLDEEKIECSIGNREIWFLARQNANNVVFLFLTSGFMVFICL